MNVRDATNSDKRQRDFQSMSYDGGRSFFYESLAGGVARRVVHLGDIRDAEPRCGAAGV